MANAGRLSEALHHHERGEFFEAESIYNSLLADDANDADALHLLGVLFGQTDRREQAIISIRKAIALSPPIAAQFNNLGNVLRDSGRISEAIAAFQTSVEIDPSHARAWNNLGNALGDHRQTLDAIDAYRRSLQLSPDVAEVHSNLGIALREAGQIDESITAHSRAIELAPDSSEAFNNLGAALLDKGRISEAVAAHAKAVTLKPSSISAMSNLGAALRRNGQADQAIELLSRVIAKAPTHADAHNNLASARIDQGDFAAAIESCELAIKLRPDFADAHANLAIALAYLGQVERAMLHARHAARIMPDHPLTHWNLSMLLLLVGDFELGWREHEWRWKCSSMLKQRSFHQPRWDGEALNGQTVLLFAEQGFGDTLQFIRFASIIAQVGGRAIVECQPQLLRLFDGMPGVWKFIAAGDPLPDFDLQCPLMSLPFALRSQTVLPVPAPYLFARNAGVKDDQDRFHVGVIWAGDPSHQNDRARSISLAMLSPLAALRTATFHSLQKGPAASQIKETLRPFTLIDHTQELTDFAATADIIHDLDLIVTVDTAVAHLAGAMGKPTFVMLPFMPDWRWMLHRSDSDWYPTMRLFRQKTIGDWTSVIEEVTEAVQSKLNQRAAAPR